MLIRSTTSRMAGVPIFLAAISLSAGCSVTQLNSEATHVRIVVSADLVEQCQYVSEVIGSEGHWYDFIYISNRDLLQAALNDMRNQAAKINANTLYISNPHNFRTSVTLLGYAYNCAGNTPK